MVLGAFVGWIIDEGVSGPALTNLDSVFPGRFVLPGRPAQNQGGSFEWDNCTYKVVREQYETITEHVTGVRISTRCDGAVAYPP